MLRSAVANAENNHELDPDELVVKSATATKGGMLHRIMPRARGSAGGIKKRMAHITVIVAPKEEEKTGKKRNLSKKAESAEKAE